MGYTTDFSGEWKIVPPLSPEHRAYLTQFAQIRHMTRDVLKLATRPDPLRNAVGLPLGREGQYYVGTDDRYKSQGGILGDTDPSIVNSNQPPNDQPGLWCQWVPDLEGRGEALVWDEGEKFYNYVEWLKYLIKHFLTPWGYSLAGVVNWNGEEDGDFGMIKIESPSNEVLIAEGVQEFGPWRLA